MRLRKIPMLLLNSALMNHFLFLKGSMSGHHQCIWSGFGEVSHTFCRLFVFLCAIANENDLSFVQCMRKPSSMKIAAYVTANNTEMEPELKIFLQIILLSFQTSLVGMMIQSIFFLFFLIPNSCCFHVLRFLKVATCYSCSIP